MDLLGDLGNSDQLTAARAENAVLADKVKQLSFRVKELSIENESLKAEVELYRKEAALPNFSRMALGGGGTTTTTGSTSMDVDDNASAKIACDDFMRSGNGVYPQQDEITLLNLHDNANILCCAMSPNDVILATGGADAQLVLAAWGAACDEGSAKMVVEKAVRLTCTGPVITVAFAPEHTASSSTKHKCVAAGCMDGSVQVAVYEMVTGTGLVLQAAKSIPTKHDKYCKKVAWKDYGNNMDNNMMMTDSNTNTNNTNNTNNPLPQLLASASADGTIQVHQVLVQSHYNESTDTDEISITIQTVETLHLDGGVEALCFVKDELCCYARGKPYLQCFNTLQDYALRKMNLNSGGKPVAAGTTLEDQHVSFAVLDMVPSPSSTSNTNKNKYLALATDASRNIIVDYDTGLQVRNLYGHQNDGFSNPRVAWSANGQYLLGNTQDDGSLCVWDIASTKLVQRMSASNHGQTIRDLYSSTTTDTLVTTSFDKQTKIWFAPPT